MWDRLSSRSNANDESNRMLRPYIVYYKFKIPGDKTQGAVKQFRIYATSFDEARRLATRQANYPHVEVLNVKPA
jgi:hypothetical protein